MSRRDRLKYGILGSNEGSAPRPFDAGTGLKPPGALSLEIQRKGRTLSRAERGLIILPPVRVEGSSFSTVPFDNRMLYKGLLYFDHLEYPENNFIEISLPGEVSWLQKEGHLSRSRVVGSGFINFPRMIEFAMSELEKSSPGSWCTANFEGGSIFGDRVEKGRGLLFELHNAIPIPERETPLDDVLNFKSRRENELKKLRHHLDKVYMSVIEAPDRPLSESSAFSELDLAVKDALRVSKESRIKFEVGAVSVNLATLYTAGDFFQKAAQSTGSISTAGLAAASVLAAGALGSISVGAGLAGKKAKGPFEYVCQAHQRL